MGFFVVHAFLDDIWWFCVIGIIVVYFNCFVGISILGFKLVRSFIFIAVGFCFSCRLSLVGF